MKRFLMMFLAVLFLLTGCTATPEEDELGIVDIQKSQTPEETPQKEETPTIVIPEQKTKEESESVPSEEKKEEPKEQPKEEDKEVESAEKPLQAGPTSEEVLDEPPVEAEPPVQQPAVTGRSLEFKAFSAKLKYRKAYEFPVTILSSASQKIVCIKSEDDLLEVDKALNWQKTLEQEPMLSYIDEDGIFWGFNLRLFTGKDYDEAFFKENALFLIYQTTNVVGTSYSVEAVANQGDTLRFYLRYNNLIPGTLEDEGKLGWLMVIEVAKNDLNRIIMYEYETYSKYQ